MSSDLERRFETVYKLLTRNKNIPIYIREFKFHPDRKWRFDFAWPNYKIAVEVDGMAWQAGGGKHNTDRDREKINNAMLLEWHVFRFSGKQIREAPERNINMVLDLLISKERKNFIEEEKASFFAFIRGMFICEKNKVTTEIIKKISAAIINYPFTSDLNYLKEIKKEFIKMGFVGGARFKEEPSNFC